MAWTMAPSAPQAPQAGPCMPHPLEMGNVMHCVSRPLPCLTCSCSNGRSHAWPALAQTLGQLQNVLHHDAPSGGPERCGQWRHPLHARPHPARQPAGPLWLRGQERQVRACACQPAPIRVGQRPVAPIAVPSRSLQGRACACARACPAPFWMLHLSGVLQAWAGLTSPPSNPPCRCAATLTLAPPPCLPPAQVQLPAHKPGAQVRFFSLKQRHTLAAL